MARRIEMIEGSSVAPAIVEQVRSAIGGAERVLVILDSNHTHEHVLAELQLYAPLVTEGSYLIVMDTVVEDMPADAFPDRPWGTGDNPMTAMREFLAGTDRFEIDQEISDKLVLTVAPSGYLRCLAP
jgi:cephalosporin hydroxylase